MDTFLKRARKYAVTGLAGGLLVLGATAVKAETTVVVGYQRIVGPFVSAIADGSFDKAAKEIGYKIDWRQFSSAGDISTAFASGDGPVGVLGSQGITAAVTRGVAIKLFLILATTCRSEAQVERND